MNLNESGFKSLGRTVAMMTLLALKALLVAHSLFYVFQDLKTSLASTKRNSDLRIATTSKAVSKADLKTRSRRKATRSSS